jgi:pimeloyl-ACP methyl ester carboxylesterase
MLKRYMHKRERYFAMLGDNRVVRPFEWGTEFITGQANGDEPQKLFADFSEKILANSVEFFSRPEIKNYRLCGQSSPPYEGGVAEGRGGSRPRQIEVLTWTSSVSTPSPENDTAYATWFPHETNRKAAVVVLPHWNAKAGTYFDLCRFFNKVGLSALRLTLPYHEERMPPELERADYLVAPNIGRTLQSIRQSVADTRAAVAWLKAQGYEKVGMVGTSVGSCVAFLAFLHDREIDAAVFNHVSGYIADVVWHGLSTYHVRAGLSDNIDLDELRQYWLPISPMAYMDRLAEMPYRPQRYIYTLYDLSFPVELSRDVMRELRRRKIKHSESRIPCGHYTLGEKPWVYLDGYKIISFLHKHLK